MENRNEQPKNTEKRILARRRARELTHEEVAAITGGGVSCSAGRCDDCCNK